MAYASTRDSKDYVIATGYQVSVREFINMSAEALGWKGIKWKGTGINEVGIREDNDKIVVRVDERYFRPAEVSSLLGDASKAKNELGWEPKISLKEMIKENDST